MAGLPSSTRSGPSPQPARANLDRVFDGPAGRILCVADIRGQHSLLNQLAKETGARAIIHTGDFGFFENESLDRINERTLKHLLQYSPLIPAERRDSLFPKDAPIDSLRMTIRNSPAPLLSEFPLLRSGKVKLNVPVYTISGACEDVAILERFRAGEYDIENLYVVDEATSRTLDIGGIKLRLLGLGGALVPHRLFDNGDGQATIAGGQGTVWTTALQIGELVDTAQRTHDPTETRILITHAGIGREGLLAQLGLAVKADLTISAALHFRYASSWNEFSIGDGEAWKAKLKSGQENFTKVWDGVKDQVLASVDDQQRTLMEKAMAVSNRLFTPGPNEDPAWKNTWNWNLCDAAFGHLVLDIKEGRIGAELKSQGFNFGYRRAPPSTTTGTAASTPATGNRALPSSAPSPAPAASPALGLPARPASSLNTPKPQPNGTTSAPASNNATPAPLTNGTNGTTNPAASPELRSNTMSPAGGKPPHKKKLSNAERKERKAERAAASEAESVKVSSKPGSPAPSAKGAAKKKETSSPAPSPSPAPNAEPASENWGATPTQRKPKNPWTLYVNRLPIPFTEQELRDAFGESKDLITFVKLMWHGPGPNKVQKPMAFVEFKDEESMRTALAKDSWKVKDQPIRVVVAENRDEPNVLSDGTADSQSPSQGFRGGGRGSFRGGRGGGPGRGGFFAQEFRRSMGPGSNTISRAGGNRKGSDGSANDLRPSTST